MKKILSLTAIAVVLSFAGFSVQANAATGKALFQANCAACHGANAKGVVGPNIRGKDGKDVKDALASVAMMAGLKGTITKTDAEAIGKYLKSLKK